MKPIKRIAVILLATIATLVIVAVAFIYSGAYNVAATTGHTKPIEQIFRTLMMRSVVAHARHVTPPPNLDLTNRALAARAAGHYEKMCRTCHGAPGKKPDPWQLYPAAPDLADALRVMKWSDGEVFWIIKNGIKDTGMSAFGRSHSDEDIWALTAFIRQLETMTPEKYRTMSDSAAPPDKEGTHGNQQSPAQEKEAPSHKH
jgi:cytochrome c553